ncbi:LOW QUALITY PROTEIN: uncharacterized protein Dere_GG19075 [Drosophila erecta]|uniref:Uncharacterized protein n=1 Tax=Drosophila erecta TaxID=7220 RepID=B3NW77_DROER|nr:LOW QUALITY PROTEIN: uncharacterized protein Dere_GG19075 [Drosophila erecta]
MVKYAFKDVLIFISNISGITLPNQSLSYLSLIFQRPTNTYSASKKKIYILNIPKMSSSDESQDRYKESSLDEIHKRSEILAKEKVILELFSLFVETPGFYLKYRNRKLDEMIVVKLLEHLDTKDVDDRIVLHALLRRIYIKLFDLRSFMQTQFNNVFYRFIFETNDLHCIAELLEIYKDIIKAYTPPLDTEQEQVLFRILLPLHKPQSMPEYFPQLIYCIITFLDTNPSLIERYVIGLLKLWPKTSFDKETLFLNELASILVIRDEQEVEKVLVPVFKQIAKCLSSKSSKITEYTIQLWEDTEISELMRRNNEVIMPIVFPSLFRLKRLHLGERMQKLICIALQMLLRMNRKLFISLTAEYIRAEEN